MIRPNAALVLALALAAAPAFAQVAVYPASKPGTYDMIDRAKIENKNIQWSRLSQKRDYETYKNALNEMDQAYKALYGRCTDAVNQDGSWNLAKCTGLNRLRAIHDNTIVTRKSNGVSIDELMKAIRAYESARDLFNTKLEALSVLNEAWADFAKQPSRPKAEADVYRLGMMNLKSITQKYKDALTKMDGEANDLTYGYDNGVRYVESKPGEGLKVPAGEKSAAYYQKEFDRLKENFKFSDNEKVLIGDISRELSRALLSYTNSQGTHFYWFNGLQKEDAEAWVKQFTEVAQVLKWTRAAGCMTIGVPALAIPEPKSFNRGYLTRGVADRIRLADKTEYNSNNIQTTLNRLDEVFVSLQSQNGEFNNEGGIMGFLNKVNSTFTWHNEVRAWMNAMRVLRQNMKDELLLLGSASGCEQVKKNYIAMYGEYKSDAAKNLINKYYGLSFASAQDGMRKALSNGGSVIMGKIRISQQIQKMKKEHPDLVDDVFSELE